MNSGVFPAKMNNRGMASFSCAIAEALVMLIRFAMADAAGHAIIPAHAECGRPVYSSYCKRVRIRAAQEWLPSDGPR